jgi:hypothetical protein
VTPSCAKGEKSNFYPYGGQPAATCDVFGWAYLVIAKSIDEDSGPRIAALRYAVGFPTGDDTGEASGWTHRSNRQPMKWRNCAAA